MVTQEKTGMTGKLSRLFPWHIILVPLFFVWHAYNSIFGLMPMSYVFQYLGWYIGLGCVAFALSFAVFRDRIRAGVMTGCFLLLFFFWGAGHDWLREHVHSSLLVSYKFLLPLFVIAFMGLLIWLKRAPSKPLKLHAFLLLLSFFFIAIELFTSIAFAVSGKDKANNLAMVPLEGGQITASPGKVFNDQLASNSSGEMHHTNDHGNNLSGELHDTNHNADNSSGDSLARLKQPVPTDSLPDIFLFVFDELASTEAIRKFYGFDNSSLDSTLRARGFYVAGAAKSNYNSTVHSLASILNAQYLDRDLEQKPMDGLTVLQAERTIRESSVASFLAANNYEIRNLGLCQLGSVKTSHDDYFEATVIAILADQTVWGRLKKEVLWNVLTLKGPPATDRIWNQVQHADSIRSVMNRSLDETRKISARPRLVWSHLMITHKPFLLDARGGARFATAEDETDHRLRDSLYIDQVKFCDQFIDSISLIAAAPRNRAAIFILTGDHGNRDPVNANIGISSEDLKEKDFMNFTAIRFPDANYQDLYPSISPVNHFRVILNKYFDRRLPLLPDSTISMKVFNDH